MRDFEIHETGFSRFLLVISFSNKAINKNIFFCLLNCLVHLFMLIVKLNRDICDLFVFFLRYFSLLLQLCWKFSSTFHI
jgi:hypothetical protein